MRSGIPRALAAIALLAACAGVLRAEPTAYVTDTIRLALRAGPAADQKSLGVVESGQAVDILRPGEEWTLVRSAAGLEGWVPTRYLTEQPPPKLLAARLQEKNRELDARAAALGEENTRLREENRSLAEQLTALRRQFEALRRDASDVEGLRARLESARAELAAKEEALRRRGVDLPDLLLRREVLYAFLAGAGVLLAGFVLGWFVRRRRRWSSLA